MAKGSKTRREQGRARARERAEAVREARRAEGEGAGPSGGAGSGSGDASLGRRIWSVVGPSRPLLLIDTAVVAALGLFAAWLTPDARRLLLGSREAWAFMMAVCGAWLALSVITALMHFYYVGTGQAGRKAFGKDVERQSLFLWSIFVLVSTLALALNLAA